MEEGWSAVTVATGALGPVLAKLSALLGDEYTQYRLLEESRRDVEFIKGALEPVHSLLLRAWELQHQQDDIIDPDAAPASKPPAWIIEARELSYDMDDHINDFVCSLERDDNGGFVQQVTNVGPFGHLKIQVEALTLIVDESCCSSPVGKTIPSDNSKPTVDPRTGFFHRDASELVGMDGQEKELIKFLVGGEGDDAAAASVQEQRIVCITGSAGMGKTTLADLLYHETGDQFQCRAFVPLSPTSHKTEVFDTILKEVSNGAPSAASITNGEVDNQCLINDIANFLAHKRYLIVFDNIWYWNDWEAIRSCLPNNDMGSRIIITTRNNDIAEKCRMGNNALVYKMLGISMDAAVALSQRIVCASGMDMGWTWACFSIAHMSGGAPLGVICMSLAVAELNQKNGPGSNPLDFVLQEFCNMQCLRPLVDSLCLGYKVLPLHLQTCLLYCSIHHKSDWVERDQLTRIWIAEGFVQEEEEAQGYFAELVNLGFIRRCKCNGDASSGFRTLRLVGGRQLEVPIYEINQLMLHFLKCKSEENNLVTCWDHHGPQLLSASKSRRIHRLSAPCYQQDSIDVSHARSLIVFDIASWMIPFNRFERLRVLDLSYFFVRNSDLVEICQLLLLRHLGLKGTSVSELPREIGGLCHLEFLDLRYTEVRELPWEVGRTSESLRLLVGDKDSTDGVRLPKGVQATWKDMTLSSWLAKWSRDLSIILFDRFNESSWEPLPVARSKFATRHMNLQQQILRQLLMSEVSTSVRELEEDGLKFLQHEMPNLQFLELTLGLLPTRPIAISAGGFSTLESFIVDSRLPRLTFQPGAMPKLRHLEFKFYAGLPCDEPMGITHLCSLQKVVFRSSRWYKSHAPGISTTIAVVRKEAMEHRNRITLCINGDQEVFPQNASASYVLEGESANGASDSSLESGMLQVKLAPNGITTVTEEEVSAVRSAAGCSSRMIEIEEA